MNKDLPIDPKGKLIRFFEGDAEFISEVHSGIPFTVIVRALVNRYARAMKEQIAQSEEPANVRVDLAELQLTAGELADSRDEPGLHQ